LLSVAREFDHKNRIVIVLAIGCVLADGRPLENGAPGENGQPLVEEVIGKNEIKPEESGEIIFLARDRGLLRI